MGVCGWVCVRAFMHAYVCVWACMHVCVCVCVCVSVCVCAHAQAPHLGIAALAIQLTNYINCSLAVRTPLDSKMLPASL